MNTIHSKKRSRLLLADLAAWERENGEDNALRLERLRRNLRQARLQELTGRQQQVLTLFFDEQMNMTEIAAALGIHRSLCAMPCKGDFPSCGFSCKTV